MMLTENTGPLSDSAALYKLQQISETALFLLGFYAIIFEKYGFKGNSLFLTGMALMLCLCFLGTLTPAEKRVLEVLTLCKGTDGYIASKLYISIGIVKPCKRSNKKTMKITTRYGLIYACRNNFQGERVNNVPNTPNLSTNSLTHGPD